MKIKFLAVRKDKAWAKHDEAMLNLADRFGVEIPNIEKDKANHPDQEHRELFKFEAMAQFLHDLDVATQE